MTNPDNPNIRDIPDVAGGLSATLVQPSLSIVHYQWSCHRQWFLEDNAEEIVSLENSNIYNQQSIYKLDNDKLLRSYTIKFQQYNDYYYNIL